MTLPNTISKFGKRLEGTGVKEMAYIISSDTVGLAIGSVSETTNDVHEALSKARQMYGDGLANVSIKDETGRKIDSEELVACITGKKKLTEDLRAV